MQTKIVRSFQINDPEAGSALALLLAAAGYEVEADFNDGTAFLSMDDGTPELALLDDVAPHMSGYDLACQLCERLDRQANEAKLPRMRNELHYVA